MAPVKPLTKKQRRTAKSHLSQKPHWCPTELPSDWFTSRLPPLPADCVPDVFAQNTFKAASKKTQMNLALLGDTMIASAAMTCLLDHPASFTNGDSTVIKSHIVSNMFLSTLYDRFLHDTDTPAGYTLPTFTSLNPQATYKEKGTIVEAYLGALSNHERAESHRLSGTQQSGPSRAADGIGRSAVQSGATVVWLQELYRMIVDWAAEHYLRHRAEHKRAAVVKRTAHRPQVLGTASANATIPRTAELKVLREKVMASRKRHTQPNRNPLMPTMNQSFSSPRRSQRLQNVASPFKTGQDDWFELVSTPPNAKRAAEKQSSASEDDEEWFQIVEQSASRAPIRGIASSQSGPVGGGVAGKRRSGFITTTDSASEISDIVAVSP